jgi:hypothetical protein
MAPKTAAPVGLSIRLRADRSDPSAQAAELPGAPPGTWPLLGVEAVDLFQRPVPWPQRVRVAEGAVQRWISQGAASGESHEVVTRPAGTAADPWAPTPTAPTPHIFHQYERITFKGMDGDVTYRVTHQPDKYAAEGDDSTPVTDELYAAGDTRVDWFYDLELEG